MIINHDLKFIFIHVPKTGGTSVYHLPNQNFKKSPEYPLHIPFKDLPNYPDYFSFGFTRNPWARMHSLWKFENCNGEDIYPCDFKEYLLEISKNRWYGCGNNLSTPWNKMSSLWWLKGVDYIGRFEHMQDEWNFIFDIIDIPRMKIELWNQSPISHYHEIYNKETKKFIEIYHNDDISQFEYYY